MDSSSSPRKRQSHGVKRGACSESGQKNGGGGGGESRQQQTKVLINVNIQNSCGAVQVVMPPGSTVRELTKAAIGIYVRDKRRPLLGSSDPECYELHYSQFSLESLKPEEKLMELGSRNFFLCRKPGCAVNSSTQPRILAKSPFIVTKFINFLL